MNQPYLLHQKHLAVFLLMLFCISPAIAQEPMARGVVFVDANNNRQFDEGEKTLANVRVSNGTKIVKTDANGKYQIPCPDDTIVFVIQPSGYRVPMSKEMLPQFYYIHKPEGSPKLKYKGVAPTGPLPKSIDFPLYPQNQPKSFKAVLFGDPQPRNQKEVNYVAHDVVSELIGTDASFGVTLGDIAFDNLNTFEEQAKAVALIGIPWYNVIGNHDINYDARNRKHANETYERVFGPSYYSFDYGSVHFMVLDDIDWYEAKNKKDPKKTRWAYRGGLGKEQMEFIRNDLAMIPEDQMVVLMMHIPLVDVKDRKELYRIIEKRPFCISISGHTHYHEHRFITKEDGWRGPQPHHHIINVTVSGSWWGGLPDERGIPQTMMRDGAPNGYSIISFDGKKYTLDYKAAGRPASYQMNIQAPDETTVDKLAETDVYVNVFNGSEKSKVEMRVVGESWLPMERKVAVDPLYQSLSKRENATNKLIQEKNQEAEEEKETGKEKKGKEKEKEVKLATWTNLPGPTKSSHLWHAKLPTDIPVGVHLLQVRTTDMHGRTYQGYRVLRVVEATVATKE